MFVKKSSERNMKACFKIIKDMIGQEKWLSKTVYSYFFYLSLNGDIHIGGWYEGEPCGKHTVLKMSEMEEEEKKDYTQ